MKPAVVIHRHFFTVSEVAKILLGEYADDCDAWEMRVEDGDVIVDVVGPFIRETTSAVSHDHNADEQQETAPGEEEPLKGGPVARKAGILCGEKGFQVFLEVKTPEAAGELIRRECKIDSRAMLDHNAEAARTFNDIAAKYTLWLDGHD